MLPSVISALKCKGVTAAVLAVGIGVAYLPRGGADLEAIEAAASRPLPHVPDAMLGYHFPAPESYPILGKPWIKSRADLIEWHTRGEDPAVVRRYSEGPEEDLIAYLGEVHIRRYPTAE